MRDASSEGRDIAAVDAGTLWPSFPKFLYARSLLAGSVTVAATRTRRSLTQCLLFEENEECLGCADSGCTAEPPRDAAWSPRANLWHVVLRLRCPNG